MTLVDFLLARIAEDEAVAREAEDGRWFYAAGKQWDQSGNVYSQADDLLHAVAFDRGEDSEGCVSTEDGLHIARHDPVRVLAECEAKRRIIDEHPTAQAYADNGALMEECRRCSSHSYEGLDDEVVEYPCPTLRLLAVPYADQPDYREEWRP